MSEHLFTACRRQRGGLRIWRSVSRSIEAMQLAQGTSAPSNHLGIPVLIWHVSPHLASVMGQPELIITRFLTWKVRGLGENESRPRIETRRCRAGASVWSPV